MPIRRERRARALLGLIMPTLVAAACAPPRPQSRPEPAPRDPVEAATEPSAAGPWRFAYATGIHRFELRNEAIVEAPETGAADTVALSAYITYLIDRPSDSTIIRGTVDSFAVEGGSAAPTGGAVVLPIPFELITDQTGRIQHFTSPDTSSCGSPAGTLLTIARDLLVMPPSDVWIGARWADTISATSCRGDIPITMTSARSFAVHRASIDDGNVLLHIRRESTIVVSGSGTRRIQSTTVTGHGRGSSEQILDPATGALVGGHGEATLELTFDAASRRMAFRQHVRQTIRRIQ